LGAWRRSAENHLYPVTERSVRSSIARSLGIRLRLVVAVLLGVSLLAPNTLSGLALASPVLTRYPYLTDATSTSVLVNFATNTPSSTATPVVSWGAAGGSCNTNTVKVNAGITITVATTTEYQYKGLISGLSPNTSYCYRVNQGNSNPDLLGSDASPTFTTALTAGAGSSYSFAVVGDFGAGTIDENKVLAQVAKSNASFIVTAGDNAYNAGSQSDYGDLSAGNVFGPAYWKQVGAKLPAFPAHGNHGFTTYLSYLQNWPEDSVVRASGGTQQASAYCGVPTIPSCGSGSKTYGDTWYAFDWGVARYYVLEGAWADGCGGAGPSYSCDAQAHFGSVSGCTPCGKELTWLQNDLAAHTSTPMKFAFWHYPLYSDNTNQPTDCFLNSRPASACPSPPYTGAYNLEGLLANNNVDIVFNGHAHEYERNRPQTPGSPLVNYVTGGGGDPLTGGGCKSSFCAVSSGTFHYLLVNVNGAHMTVTPIDENGVQFDVQNYDFSATINGTVTAAGTGLPIAGAAVSGAGSNSTTNGSGQYTLTNVLPGTPSVSVSAPGFVTATQAVTVGPTKTATSSFSLAASSNTGSVTGIVTNSSGGAVISGATVSDSGGASATTNASGAYTLSGLAAGSHSLTASAAGFTASQPLPTSVIAGQTTSGANFSLTPSPTTGAVAGTVTSSAGGAISGATVTDTASAISTSTDASGNYTLGGLAAGGHSLTASAAGYTTSQPQATSVTAGQTTSGVNFGLAPAVSSAPQLVQATGANETAASTSLTANFAAPTGAGHLLVLSASLYTGATSPITSVTDSGGNTWTRVGAFFVSGHSSDGEMWYSANAKATSSVVVHTTGTVVTAMAVQEFSGVATTSPLDVSTGTSNTSTAASSGSVTPTASTDLVVGFVAGHTNAEAISVGAGYTAQAQQTSTAAGSTPASVVTGYKVLTTASAQAFTGSFGTAMYWAAGIAGFKAGTGPPTTGAVSGTVTNSLGGAIPAGATVTDSNTSTPTDASGNYTLSSLAAGSHSLTASASGFTTSLAQVVTVTAGQTLPGISFILIPTPTTGAVSGTVTSSLGGAIPGGATVTDSNTSTTTDAQGNYTLSSLAAGSHSLTASASGFTTSLAQVVTVTAGQTLPGISFILTPTPTTGAVSGTVTSSLGGAIPGGATVTDSNTSTTTDAQGNYTLSSLAAGSHSLTASASGFTTSLAQVVTVTAGQTLPGISFILTPTASSAPQLVQATGANETAASTSLTANFAAPTAAGHLLVLSASLYTGATSPITSVTDSGGNTWTRIGAFFVSGHNSDGEMWYSANAKSATSVVVHTTGTVVTAMAVQEFSGVSTTSPLDVSTGTSNTSTAAISGSVTPTASTDLVVGFVAGHSNAEAISVGAGYTAQAQQTSTAAGSTPASVVTGYKVLTTASAQAFTASFTTAMYWAAGIVSFKAGP